MHHNTYDKMENTTHSNDFTENVTKFIRDQIEFDPKNADDVIKKIGTDKQTKEMIDTILAIEKIKKDMDSKKIATPP